MRGDVVAGARMMFGIVAAWDVRVPVVQAHQWVGAPALAHAVISSGACTSAGGAAAVHRGGGIS